MDRLGGSFGPHDSDDHLDYDVEDHDSAAEAPPSPVGQDERRMQVRAYNHWASLLGDRNFPHIEDLYPEELADFGPYSVLLDFSLGIEDPAIQYLGGELAAECEVAERQIETLSDVPSRSLLSRITDHYMQILANQAPIGFEAEFVNQSGLTVLYRGILLPYSSDNETIDFIYGVINWKAMADQHTADALLLEIDQALGDSVDEDDAVRDRPVETAENLTEPAAFDDDPEETAVLDLGYAEMIEDATPNPLPQPAFGTRENSPQEDAESTPASSWFSAPAVKAFRGVDALGNPIGSGANLDLENEYFDEDENSGGYDGGMKTAADYGLPDWDDEPEDDDVDGVVDPLADEETGSSLTSLVSRGMRNKKSVDLSVTDPQASIPHAYEGEGVSLPAFDPAPYAAPQAPVEDPAEIIGEDDFVQDARETRTAENFNEADPLESVAASPPEEGFEPAASFPIAVDDDDASTASDDVETPEGLYDCLASARELAQAALTTEDRSRKALYAAVGRAYDFSLEAETSRDEYEELIADNGLTVQDRAPMTPIVKLVFGADYDKTRLTEYAAVLMHAHRVGVERGQLVPYLRQAEGGLKGVVGAERRARKEEQGKPVEEAGGIRAALAKKLRQIESGDFAALDEDGPEFALVMVRRTESGELVVVGEVPEDVPLLEKAARRLLG